MTGKTKTFHGVWVAVLGAARSGVAAAELLAEAGARVLLSDVRPDALDSETVQRLRQMGVAIELGGHSVGVLEAEWICISPGIPLTVPILREAAEKGIPIVGELELASRFCRAPIVAITGSNGKTTTTTLTGEILKRRFSPVLVGGNIGVPLAKLVREIPQPQVAVLEVSSFQLETIVEFHPHIGVIMNLTPNHLDRYPDFEAYVQAKLQLLKNMQPSDMLIYNADDALLSRRVAEAAPQKIPFSTRQKLEEGAWWEGHTIRISWGGQEQGIPVEQPRLRGPHNRYNMAVAALIGVLHGVPEETIGEVLESFPGIEHRLEVVRVLDGVQYVNDTKATSVDALRYALQSFEEPLVLIAGGKDKGGDYADLNHLLREHVRAAVLIGEAAPRMQRAWQGVIPVYPEADLEAAVHRARRLAQPGDVVLLSPACSSFDMFDNYEQRGQVFKRIVRQLNGGHGA